MKICKWYYVCPMKNYFEKGLLDEKWIKNYCKDDWKNCIRFKMEENFEYHEDWMLPDGTLNLELKGK